MFNFQAATKKQKYEKISEKKMGTPIEGLCKVSIPNIFLTCISRGLFIHFLFIIPLKQLNFDHDPIKLI